MTAQRILLGCLLGLPFATSAQVNVPNTFEAGEPAVADDVNANFEALADVLSDVAERVGNLEPQPVPVPPLAVEIVGDDSPMRIRGIEQGGVVREPGAMPDPDPLIVHGLPGSLSDLIGYLASSTRIDGRLLSLAEDTATPLQSFSSAYIVELNLPVVGPNAESPFEVQLSIDPEDADLGPFAPEQATAPVAGDTYEPAVELSLGSLGVTLTALSSEPLGVTRCRGCRLATTNPALRVDAAEAGPVLTAFMSGRRISDIDLRYLRPDGSVALAITAMHARIIHAVPDYAGDGVRLELALQEPGLAEY